MPPLESLATFAVGLAVLGLSPGPDFMLLLARGIGQGHKVALMTVVGMTLVAGPIQVTLLVLGVASLLRSHPEALTLLRWLGAGYLIWLGARLILSPAGKRAADQALAGVSTWAAMREGAINSLTNPKSLLFMFAFLPQFVDPAAGPVWLQLLVLGTIQKVVGIFTMGGVALAAGSLGAWLARRPKFLVWQKRFSGMVMIGLGIRLLFSGNSTPPTAARL
jgi:threonine/homoserine/homoserine lactone efflux protein